MTMPQISKRHMRSIFIAAIAAATVTAGSVIKASYLSFDSPAPAPSTEAATLLVSNSSKQASSEERGRTCLPDGVSESYFIGEFSDQFQTFLLWRLTVDNRAFLRVNTLFGEACGLAFDGRSDRTFGDQVSQEESQQLWLLFYKDRANVLGGSAALQQDINEQFENLEDSHTGGPILFEPSAIWALEQLGITLPPNGDWELLQPI